MSVISNPLTRQGITCLTWSPVGNILAFGTYDGEIQIWDSDEGQLGSSTRKLTGKPIDRVSWSLNGSHIAALDDRTLRVLNLTTEPPQFSHTFELEVTPGVLEFLMSQPAWSLDGKIASSSEGIVTIWNLSTQSKIILDGRRFHHRQALRLYSESLSWASNGFLASGYLGDICLWDPSGRLTARLEGHSGNVESIAWSHDGSRIASASRDGTVRVRDPKSCQCLAILPMDYFGCVSFDKYDCNKLYTGSGTFVLDPHWQNITTPVKAGQISRSPRPVHYGMNKDGDWITYKGMNLLFLPPEYRPQGPELMGMFGTTFVIGFKDRELLICKFSENPSFDLW